MKEFHILNLGAGVQSTALYLMSLRKEFGIPWFDYAIFADTGDEPQDVYRHVEWLQSLNGPKILIRNAKLRDPETTKEFDQKIAEGWSPSNETIRDQFLGRIGDDLINGGSGRSRGTKRFASIPAYTVSKTTQAVGLTRRQCTKEYKTEVIEKCVRQDIFGLKPKERIAGRYFSHTYLGLSAEETRRVKNNMAIFERMKKWQKVHFPLWSMGWHRAMIKDWLKDKVPHETPRSACTFCPFHDNAEWQRIKASPVDWERACHIDDMLRQGAHAAQNMVGTLYVHRSCVPLRDAVLTTDESETHELAFSGVAATDCTGFCGH